MTSTDRQDVTQAFLNTLAADTPPRLAFVLERLVHHLHALARETRLTHAEWRAGIDLLTRAGRITDAQRNEFVLFSDVLGLSSLLDVLHSEAGGTPSSVLGPFHVRGAPELAFGGDLKGDDNVGPTVFISGTVTDTEGRPLPGARIEFWQTASNGLYSNQDPAQAEWNLRARLRVDRDARYALSTVHPAPYAVPSDGPVGELLAATGRHPWRPAHYHVIVEAPGHRTLVTELFPADDPYLHEDAVFGVRDGLVYRCERCTDPAQAPAGFARSESPGTPFDVLRFDFTLLAEPAAPSAAQRKESP